MNEEGNSEPIISLSPPQKNQGFVRFVLRGVTKETDEVEILFSERSSSALCSDRIWRKVPGNEKWHDGSWESPPWRLGLMELEIKFSVVRSKEICFEVVTDEASCLSISSGSGVTQIFDILSLRSDCHTKQMLHACFKEGEHVFIVVPPGQALCIHRAMYHSSNVTSIIHSKLSSNPNLLSFGGDFNTIFGDPAPGIAKTLTIDYSFSLASQNQPIPGNITDVEFPSCPLSNLPFNSSKLRNILSEISISSALKNTTEYHSKVEEYLQFHTGVIGNSPNQSNRLKAAMKLREGIIQECGRNAFAVSHWSTLLRCCGRVFSKDLQEFRQKIASIDALSVEEKISGASLHFERGYNGYDREADDPLHCMASACLPFPGAVIVRLVVDKNVKAAEDMGSYLGEYCRSLFSVSGRPIYQHSSGAYFLWYHLDRWCVGSRRSVGTSICALHSVPSLGAGQAPPEVSGDWHVLDSSGSLTDASGIRCLPGKAIPDVLTHQEALFNIVRSHFFSALLLPDSTLFSELRAWLRSLPHGILKGVNSLDDNVPSALKSVYGNLKHGILDSFAWREIAYTVALSLRGEQGSGAEEFLIDLASAEGKLEYFVETLHVIQLSRPDRPCSSALRKAYLLLLDQVDCPLLQDQAFLSRVLAPEGRAKFLAALSVHIPWARCLGEESAILLVCFLRHVIRAAQTRMADYLLQVAETISKICAEAQDLEGRSEDCAPAEDSTADNFPPVALAVAGQMHSLAVTRDGKLFAWGLDTNGRIGVQFNSSAPGIWPDASSDTGSLQHTRDALGRFVINRMAPAEKSKTTPPSPVIPIDQGVATAASSAIWAPVPILGPLLGRTVRAAASSGSHSLAITEDGSVFAWGILGKGAVARALHRIEGFPGEHPCEAACGEGHNLVLCQSGRVYAWGAADCGQLGLGEAALAPFVESPMLVGGALQNGCVRIACGLLHSAAITTGGQLFMWGFAEGGRLGVGDPVLLGLPVCERGRFAGMPMEVRGPIEGKVVIDVSCGNDVTVALLKCGEVYGWGVGFEIWQGASKSSSMNSTSRENSESAMPSSGMAMPPPKFLPPHSDYIHLAPPMISPYLCNPADCASATSAYAFGASAGAIQSHTSSGVSFGFGEPLVATCLISICTSIRSFAALTCDNACCVRWPVDQFCSL
jgi:hypothetical protein